MNNLKENIRSEKTWKEQGQKKIIHQRRLHLGGSENLGENKDFQKKRGPPCLVCERSCHRELKPTNGAWRGHSRAQGEVRSQDRKTVSISTLWGIATGADMSLTANRASSLGTFLLPGSLF